MAELFTKIKFENFFDRPAVMSAADRAEKRGLSRWGAFTRQKARGSMRKRKRSARRGEPPSVHEGGLKRLTFFAFDPNRSEVVVGPLQYRKNAASWLEKVFPFMSPAAEDVNENEMDKVWEGVYR